MPAAAFLEIVCHDVLYALRTMRKNPTFAASAILTLALGIGGNTAIFTVIRTVLLKPLGYRDPGRLVRVTVDDSQQNNNAGNFSQERFQQMRAAAQSFAPLGAHFVATENVTLSGGAGEPESLKEARVSGNFLEILGVQPVLGRSFLPEEDTRGGPAVAMIGAALWKRRFGADPRIGGRTAILDSRPFTIIGVLPAGFAFPFTGVDVWVARPSEFSGIQPPAWLRTPLLIGFGRLKPGVTLEQSRAELNVLNHQYVSGHPGQRDADPKAAMAVLWLRDQLVANVRPMLWMLFGAVGFVLLIACANVASLLLARASARSREFAVRSALGAPRSRLVIQLLAESLSLSVASGGLGLLLGQWSLSALTRVSAFNLPRAGEIRLDGLVLAFTIAISILTGLLFGLFPALRISRPDLADVLRERGTGSGPTTMRSHVRRRLFGVTAGGLLVVVQVALSVVLLIGAALLMESLARLHAVDPGFRAANLLTMQVPLPPARYDTGAKREAFFEELVRRLETLGGVTGAAVALGLPTAPVWASPIAVAEQAPVALRDRPLAQFQTITPAYFRTLGIPLRRGRDLAERDNAPGAPGVALINESLARCFWPAYPRGQDPVGQHVLMGVAPLEIVGIAADVHESGLAGNAKPEWYVPSNLRPMQKGYLAVRTAGDPKRLVNAVRSQVLAIDRDQAVSDIGTMEEVLETTMGQRRLTLMLLAVFAAVALLLAVIGIYGVIAYAVTQRTQELGIRRALGAQQGDILRLVLGQGLVLALVGVAAGIAGAFWLTRVMTGLLFHVSATDPATFAGIAILLVAVALLASYIPARRATRIDPMAALR
jgi:putative ABC transport system permease protein